MAPEPPDRAGAERRRRSGSSEVGIEVARALLDRLGEMVDVDPPRRRSIRRPCCTRSSAAGPTARPQSIAEPLIPLLDTTLLTNAPGEPRLWQPAARRDRVGRPDRRRDGLHPPQRHRPAARRAAPPLRAGPAAAGAHHDLHRLDRAGGARRARRPRRRGAGLVRHRHAPGCTPRRGCSTGDSGFSTAYVGSSNLTHSAQVTGLEWNVRVSGARNPDVIDKVAAVFESYWDSGDFVPYDAGRVRGRAAPSAAAPTRARTSSSARSSCARSRSRSACSSRSRCRAQRRAITATCSSRPPAPARP